MNLHIGVLSADISSRLGNIEQELKTNATDDVCNSKLPVAKQHIGWSVDRKFYYNFSSAVTSVSFVEANNQPHADGTCFDSLSNKI